MVAVGQNNPRDAFQDDGIEVIPGRLDWIDTDVAAGVTNKVAIKIVPVGFRKPRPCEDIFDNLQHNARRRVPPTGQKDIIVYRMEEGSVDWRQSDYLRFPEANPETAKTPGMARKYKTIFAATDILRIFPSFVWKAELEPKIHRRLGSDIIGTLDGIRRALPELAPGRSWQSDRDLHERSELRELVSCLNDAVASVLDFLKIGQKDFEITGLWANMNPPDAAHGMHSHPNNFLSGVYYVRTHKGADTINFHDPRSQTGIIRPPVMELTAENTDQVVVRVKGGTILLFPSWLAHSVDANKSDETRISVSFNVMFSAYTEKMSRPLW